MSTSTSDTFTALLAQLKTLDPKLAYHYRLATTEAEQARCLPQLREDLRDAQRAAERQAREVAR